MGDPIHDGDADLCLSPSAASQSGRQRLAQISGTGAENRCLTGRLPQRGPGTVEPLCPGSGCGSQEELCAPVWSRSCHTSIDHTSFSTAPGVRGVGSRALEITNPLNVIA